MKYLITQYGRIESVPDRQFVVEVPDDFNPENLDNDFLESLANDKGIEWQCDEDVAEAVDADYFDVEGSEEETNLEGIPVITIQEAANES